LLLISYAKRRKGKHSNAEGRGGGGKGRGGKMLAPALSTSFQGGGEEQEGHLFPREGKEKGRRKAVLPSNKVPLQGGGLL